MLKVGGIKIERTPLRYFFSAVLGPLLVQQTLGFLLVAGFKIACHICRATTILDLSHLVIFAAI